MTEEAKAKLNDVIQLDPEHCDHGPLLCVVAEIKAWGVQCYTIDPPGVTGALTRYYPDGVESGVGYAILRVKHGDYQVIGPVAWFPQNMKPREES